MECVYEDRFSTMAPALPINTHRVSVVEFRMGWGVCVQSGSLPQLPLCLSISAGSFFRVGWDVCEERFSAMAPGLPIRHAGSVYGVQGEVGMMGRR